MDVEKTAESRLAARRIVALSVMAVAFVGGAGTASAQQMSLPGKFAVSSSGAATYDIAIAVPPGTAGMVPSLKLSYSSHGVGNGLLGASWTLSGLPSIGRCAKTVAQDGSVGAITYGSTDMFCLDGQKLKAFNGGAYGVDGTAYRTEIESFNRVIQHGTPAAWFEVHTKAGQIMEFGNTTDSLILAQGTTVARNWALNKVRDTKGNYLTNGQAYPSEIDYTGNTAAGVAPYNKVQFVYLSTPRPDTMIAYQAGSFIKTNTLLTNVKTYAGASLVADYRLAYQQSASTNASEITSVTLCDAGGNCLPSARFGWSTGFDRTNPSFTALPAVNPAFGPYDFQSPPANDFLPLSGDFNGDGLTDWMMIINTAQHVFLSNGDGTFARHDLDPAFGPYSFSSPPQASFLPLTGDFNGDGLTDWMMIINTAQHVVLSNGDGTFTRHDLDPAFGSGGGGFSGGGGNLSFGSPPQAAYLPLTGDFDGDGRTDWMMIEGSTQRVFLSNGDGTFRKVEITNNAFHDGTNFGSPPQASFLPLTGDFNGDGRTDWLMVAGQTTRVFISNGDGTFAEYGQPNGGLNFPTPPQSQFLGIVGDFNGDGKSDWAMIHGPNMFVFVSMGASVASMGGAYFSFIADNNIFSPSDLGSPPDSLFQTLSGDFNGDGKVDWIMIGGPNKRVFLGDGNATIGVTMTFTPIGGGVNFQMPPQATFQAFGGDFNGDGKTDWMMVAHQTLRVFLADGGPGDFIQSITTGNGATTNITHTPITKSAVYTKDATAAYPIQNVQGPMYVVSRVDAPNGLGGSYSSAYHYAGAKTDLSGRGFLGFRQMTVTDLQTNIAHTTNFSQAFPFLGLTTSETKVLGALNLNQTTNTYQITNSSGAITTVSTPSNTNAPYQVNVSQTNASSSDLDGSVLPSSTTTYQYDSFSNPTQIVTSTSDGFSKTTANTYTNDTANWYLGRLNNATVTSTTP